MKKSTYLTTLFAALILLPSLSLARMTADQILKKIEKNNATPSEEAEMVMIIKEADGSSRSRDLTIKKKNDSQNRALVKLSSPSDLKGVGLLTIKEKGGEENQWLYLPSEKRSRRIVGSGKKKRFLDSELSYEDMRLSTYDSFSNEIVQEDEKTTTIESKPKNKNDSSYSRIKTWVYMKNYVIIKAEYYDTEGKLLKKVGFDKYKKYGTVWRAHVTDVKNVQKNRGTVMDIKKFSIKKLSDEDFSMSALEEG